MVSLPVIGDSFERPDLCGPCGEIGMSCCNGVGGAAFPEDFGAPNQDAMYPNLVAHLLGGAWSLDWWEGDPRPDRDELSMAYFIRPATKSGRGRIRHALWHGDGCVFLGESGCTIRETRPLGCRGLEPLPLAERKKNNGCRVRYGSKQDACVAWIPYTDLLERAAEEAQRLRGDVEDCR